MTEADMQERLAGLLRKAKALGADTADTLGVSSTALSASFRMGSLEGVERAESDDIGLRVMIGQRQAMSSTTDMRPHVLEALAERVVAMAKAAPEDPYCGLAARDMLAKSWPDLDLDDPVEPSADLLKRRAASCEGAALAVAGITNSEGASAGWDRSRVVLMTSDGFSGAYAGSSHAVSVSVVAGEGLAMERDDDFATSRYGEDLADPEHVGRNAAALALKRLNPRKAATASLPVVFDPRVSMSLVGHFAGAINGASIARGVSFLKDRMGQSLFAKGIAIIDDPHRKRGLRSKPFDGEGVVNRRTALVEDGVLQGWMLNTASARQLGLKTTGHGARGTGGPPGIAPTNLYMQAGAQSPAELIAPIGEGLYVTELIGMGVNGVTGDYSRGATGFWIRNGVIGEPVNEVTIAGNLLAMFRELTPANDLVFRYGTNAPTLRIEGMTIAGA